MTKKNCATLCFVLFFAIPNAFAETNLEYPELSVVPRASERLDSEAKRENSGSWQNHIPLLVPATLNLTSGLLLQLSGTKSDTEPTNTGAKYAPWVGMGVGLAWWGVTLGILENASVYSDASREVKAMPARTPREQLLRERRAEESLRAAGSLARRLKYISALSNVLAGGFMISSSQNREFSRYFAVATTLSALTPFIFPHRWETVDEIHRDYKKRIYGPIVGVSFFPTQDGSALQPGLLASLRF